MTQLLRTSAVVLALALLAPFGEPMLGDEPLVRCCGLVSTAGGKTPESLGRAFSALAEAVSEIPRDTFDPEAIVKRIGRDSTVLLAWVRDHTLWVPYEGALRGEKGVLMDRMGNSLDRSLLLAKLLHLAGHEVRLAHGELGDDQVRELLPKLQARNVASNKESPAHDAKSLQRYADKHQLDGQVLQKSFEKSARHAADLEGQSARRVQDQTQRLLQALGQNNGDDAETTRRQDADAEARAVKHHWWVQRKDGSNWLDLDAMAPGNQPLAKATKTLPVSKDGSVKLDGEICHDVEIRVIVEQWKQGTLKESTAVRTTVRPMNLYGQRLALQHMPLHWPRDFTAHDQKKPAEAVRSKVLAETEWLPVLMVGPQMIVESTFTDSGDLGKASLGQFASGLEQGIKKLDPFARLKPPGAEVRPRSDGRLTAQWIEYVIRSPGRPATTVRRQIFDVLGPAARTAGKIAEPKLTDEHRLDRGLKLMGTTEMLALGSRLSPEYVSHLVGTRILANQKVLTALVQKDLRGKALNELLGTFEPLPGDLYSLALARQRWARSIPEVYLDRPNVFSTHVCLRSDAKNDLAVCRAFDIVANPVAVRGSDKAFQARVAQGVVDTNAEALLLSGTCSKPHNTAEIFLASKDTDWLVIRKTGALGHLPLPADFKARVEADLAQGYVVLVPKNTVRLQGQDVLGWWRVNPKTGETLGMGQDGWGGAGTEKSATEGAVAIKMVVVGQLFAMACLIGSAGGGGLTNVEGGKCLAGGLLAGVGIVAAEVALILGAFIAGDLMS